MHFLTMFVCYYFSKFMLTSISGTIDEISKEVNMTWVQPRVLDLDQVW